MPYSDKDKQREYERLWIAKRRSDFFGDKKCAFCGSVENLELHHLDPEKKETHNIWSWKEDRRLAEIEKCIVLCQDCHKTETHNYRFSKLEHGSLTLYDNYGCRCTLCKAEKAIHNKQCKDKIKSKKLAGVV